jgi:exodeoxyribonuclease VII large subunit
LPGKFDDQSPRPKPWSVSQLNEVIKACVEENLPRVYVTGELSDVSRPQSGHFYFTLKDQQSQIRAVMWRTSATQLRFRPMEGMAVVAFGQVQVYAPRGTYQVVVSRLEPLGVGALQMAFRQLHQKLQAEGLFDPRRKKPLPKFPQRIGFVTSPSGAAIQDFLEVARRRWAGVRVVVIPARVQGAEAVREIVKGILAAEKITPPLDALVIGRGGGSMEDLWSFNEEAVVRAIGACRIPTVSAVGHEVDVTLADLVADLRALTPTEAAERLIPSAADLRRAIDQLATRMIRSMRYRFEMLRGRLESLRAKRIFRQPMEMIADRRRRLDELDQRGQWLIRRIGERQQQRLATLAGKLDSLSPLAVLRRGYSMTQTDDRQRIVSSVSQIHPGDAIVTRLEDGELLSKITEVHQSKHEEHWPDARARGYNPNI